MIGSAVLAVEVVEWDAGVIGSAVEVVEWDAGVIGSAVLAVEVVGEISMVLGGDVISDSNLSFPSCLFPLSLPPCLPQISFVSDTCMIV